MPLPSVVARRLDATLAGALLVAGQVLIWFGLVQGGVGAQPRGAPAAQALLEIAMTVPLLIRRRSPLLAVAAIGAAMVVQVSVVTPFVGFVSGLVPLVIANYSAAVYGGRFRALALVLTGAAETTITLIAEPGDTGDLLFGAFVTLATWVTGDVVRGFRRSAGAAIDGLELERVRSESALTAQREVIARELHDVIAHGVAVMSVQAGAARTHVDHGDPDRARAALLAVEAAARDATDELQRLLTVLRSAGGAPDDRVAQPGIADIAALADRVRNAGRPVRCTIGATPEIPAGLALTCHRIAQEALTNAVKHGTGGIDLALDAEGGRLRLRVENQAAPTKGSPSGHGLAGMRERAALYGGSLSAAPVAGRFVVVADLPLDPVATSVDVA